MTKPRVRYDLSKLQSFAKSLSKNYSVKVGILGEKTNRQEGDKTNAEIGVSHEYGSFSNKIPQRSFLRMPLFEKSEQIVEKVSKGSLALILQGNYKQVFTNLGIAAEEMIQRAFATRGFGKWKPNAPLTVKLKGSDSPLIDVGELRDSITSKVVDKK